MKKLSFDNQIAIDEIKGTNIDFNDILNDLDYQSLNIDDISDINAVKLGNAWALAKYRIDTFQAKLLRYLASQIRPEDENFKTYFFNIKELAALFDISEKNAYHEIPKRTKKMLQTVIEFKDKDRLTQINLLSVADYEKGTLKIKFNPLLKPILLQLKDTFSFSYRLNEISSFSCNYSFRWFDILKDMERANKTVKSFLISDIRSIFGIEKKEYAKYNDFKKRVIEPPHNELKEYSDLYFEFEENKFGKKVIEIVINLKRKVC